MSRVPQKEPLKASVLDRLMRGASCPDGNVSWFVDDLMETVRRDLEDLLNTRRHCRSSFLQEFRELRESLVDYGLPDFSDSSMGSPQKQDDFRREIEDTIRKYEPRLTGVTVEREPPEDEADRTLRFRIRAVLNVWPEPLRVVFDSSLQPLTATFRVHGGGQ